MTSDRQLLQEVVSILLSIIQDADLPQNLAARLPVATGAWHQYQAEHA